jgi:CheY-like chemotaxis protein
MSTNGPRKFVLLVVEDEVLIALMIAEQLEELGYSVAGPAHSLERGKQLASEAPIDGALIDINLGRFGFSGPIGDILITRKIPFLFASGYVEAPVERFRHIPILPKPFTVERLRSAVEHMLTPAAS